MPGKERRTLGQRRRTNRTLGQPRPTSGQDVAPVAPDGFIGQMFRVLGRHLPPPAGVQSPSLWGVESHLRALFGEQAAHLRITTRHFNFRYRSPAHFIEVFRTWYGPVHKAFAALGADAAVSLERDLTELLHRLNRGGADALIVPSEYAEIVITRG
jgi:hypothetical protein